MIMNLKTLLLIYIISIYIALLLKRVISGFLIDLLLKILIG